MVNLEWRYLPCPFLIFLDLRTLWRSSLAPSWLRAERRLETVGLREGEGSHYMRGGRPGDYPSFSRFRDD